MSNLSVFRVVCLSVLSVSHLVAFIRVKSRILEIHNFSSTISTSRHEWVNQLFEIIGLIRHDISNVLFIIRIKIDRKNYGGVRYYGIPLLSFEGTQMRPRLFIFG